MRDRHGSTYIQSFGNLSFYLHQYKYFSLYWKVVRNCNTLLIHIHAYSFLGFS